MIQAIASFFGLIIRLIYDLVSNNYFLSIIIFTIFTKIILLPLAFGQVKSMEKMNRVAEKQKKIQDKYKNDKEKQTEELMKLYKEDKVNPLSGCLPLLIQLPIILAMFCIVKQPLTYITQTPHEEIKTYTQQLMNKEDVNEKEMQASEITIAQEKNLIDMEVVKGINMGDIPSNVFSKDEAKKASPLSLIIPILTIAFAIIQNKLMQKNSTMTEEQKEMQKSTNIMMPILSGFISYTMPLALGIYWLVGNIFSIVQQIVINKIVKKDKEENDVLALNKGGKV